MSDDRTTNTQFLAKRQRGFDLAEAFGAASVAVKNEGQWVTYTRQPYAPMWYCLRTEDVVKPIKSPYVR
jgi:hypothetical protein